MSDKLYDAYHQEIELTNEQEACLKYSGDRTLMVKGYAGAGKSLVLMALAKKLLEKYGTDSRNKVAIFTFQNTLVSTTQEFLHVNGSDEDGVVVTTINSYIKGIYELLVQSGAAPRKKFPFNSKFAEEQRLTNVKKAISAHQSKFGKHRFHDLDPQFWLDEFDWMKDMNIWTEDMDMYLTMLRKGRGGKVRMSAQDRVTAYQLYSCYCDHLNRTGQGDWADQTLFIVRHPELIPEKMKFEHILIDEAQDLSMAQMTAIMMLYKKDMIVAMDMNQRIFGKQWTPKQLGIETTTKKLTKSMRTTKQIDALAESVRSKNDGALGEDDKSLRAIPEREGEIPLLVHLEDAAAERKYVVNLIRKYRQANDKLTIGIIAAKKNQIKVFSDWLASEDIQHERISKESTFSMARPGVKIASAYGAKGLEFDVVIIPNFAEGYFPYSFRSDDEEEMEQFMIKMRNLVYVSMTRAKHRLVITFWGNGGSRFIADMDENLYKLEGDKPVIKVPTYKPRATSSNADSSIETPRATVRATVHGNVSSDTVSAGASSGSATIPANHVATQGIGSSSGDLTDFLRTKGLEVIDKRPKGGALWVVGDKSIDPILKETRQKFGALWTFSQKGGTATKHRSGWFTKCAK